MIKATDWNIDKCTRISILMAVNFVLLLMAANIQACEINYVISFK